jgi:decaprenylphospho-beta-D-erythro-pentofuranosid-2-ulose 2-reductase
MKSAVLFGATSEIGQALIHELCDRTYSQVTFVGSSEKNAITHSEKHVSYIEQNWSDLTNLESLPGKFASLKSIDLVVVSVGYASEEILQMDIQRFKKSVEANLLWPVICLKALSDAQRMSASTQVILVSSALIDLPRTGKSFVYASLKKATEEIVVESLRSSILSGNIILLRPGYVPTKLNAHLPAGSFPSTPAKIAARVAKKIRSGKINGVVYAPLGIATLAFSVKLLPRWLTKIALQIAER